MTRCSFPFLIIAARTIDRSSEPKGPSSDIVSIINLHVHEKQVRNEKDYILNIPTIYIYISVRLCEVCGKQMF